MWSTILTTLIISVATAVMGVIAKVINDWSAREKVKATAQNEQAKALDERDARYDMLEALRIGVMNTQEAIVNDLKEKLGDGHLSKDDIKSIQKTAMEEAIKVASGPGGKLIVNTIFEVLGGLISGIVNGKKEADGK